MYTKLEDKDLIELFNTFLTKIVEHNTKHKLAIEDLSKKCDEAAKQIELLKNICKECNFKTIEDFVGDFTKRNYTDQEVSNLGAHVYEQHEIYKFHKWFKGKLAIIIGIVVVFVAAATFAEKIHQFLDYIK